MLKVAKTTISLTRGDSAYLALNIVNKEDRSPYVLHDGDSIQAQIRTEPNVGKLLVDASLENGKIYIDDNGTLTWHIAPEDTRDLAIGKYSYDVQITTAAGDIFTFITASDFNVTDEVTWHE